MCSLKITHIIELTKRGYSISFQTLFPETEKAIFEEYFFHKLFYEHDLICTSVDMISTRATVRHQKISSTNSFWTGVCFNDVFSLPLVDANHSGFQVFMCQQISYFLRSLSGQYLFDIFTPEPSGLCTSSITLLLLLSRRKVIFNCRLQPSLFPKNLISPCPSVHILSLRYSGFC